MTFEELKNGLDIFTPITAIFGAFLGGYSLYRQLRTEKVRLELVPKSAHFIGVDNNGNDTFLCSKDSFLRNNQLPVSLAFEITNLSMIPVTLKEVGFYYGGSKARAIIHNPVMSKGSWPYRLDAKDSITVYSQITQIKKLHDIPDVKGIYVSTQCGVTEKSSSKALEEMISFLESASSS